MVNAVDSMPTSLDLRDTATSLVAARPYQQFSGTVKKACLFSPSGSMNISDLFDQLEGNNPKQSWSYQERSVQLFCYATISRRFFVEIYMQWDMVSIQCSSNISLSMFDWDVCKDTPIRQVILTPCTTPLTYDEAMCSWLDFSCH